jgi:hypothetical protein
MVTSPRCGRLTVVSTNFHDRDDDFAATALRRCVELLMIIITTSTVMTVAMASAFDVKLAIDAGIASGTT